MGRGFQKGGSRGFTFLTGYFNKKGSTAALTAIVNTGVFSSRRPPQLGFCGLVAGLSSTSSLDPICLGLSPRRPTSQHSTYHMTRSWLDRQFQNNILLIFIQVGTISTASRFWCRPSSRYKPPCQCCWPFLSSRVSYRLPSLSSRALAQTGARVRRRNNIQWYTKNLFQNIVFQ